MGQLTHNVEAKVNKGKLDFFYTDDKNEQQFYTQFGYLKGEAKWAKILQADQFGNYAIDVYPSAESLADIKETVTELIEQAKKLVEDSGKIVKGTGDVCKVNADDGVEYIQFKRKELKANGQTNTPPKIYTDAGDHAASWDKLIGNGSIVKVGYQLSPYYMATTKTVGVSFKFYAVQVIKLEEYKASTSNTGFGDETDDDSAPFSTDSADF